jgi:hypothetical protein
MTTPRSGPARLCGLFYVDFQVRRLIDRTDVKNAKRVGLVEADLHHQILPDQDEELPGLMNVIQHLVGLEDRAVRDGEESFVDGVLVDLTSGGGPALEARHPHVQTKSPTSLGHDVAPQSLLSPHEGHAARPETPIRP